jgi:phosphomannomutase/phosphoglucomutase
MVDLGEKVRELGADFGIGFDGDADRMAVVDENGKLILPDRMLYLFGKEILEEEPGATIIGDAKVSGVVYKGLRELGARTVMWKTGPPLMKDKMREEGALLAGEFAAHYEFGHAYDGFDDGIYSAARFAALVSRTEKLVSTLLDDLPEPVATPEIFISCPDEEKFHVCEELLKEFSDLNPITVDGIRLEFEDGWALVRPSNTQPVLTLRFEASTEEGLARYRSMVEGKVREVLGE